jgi:hypothetical protein
MTRPKPKTQRKQAAARVAGKRRDREVRRRRSKSRAAAGDTPALAAARRSLGEAPIPAAEFVVPAGLVAITIDAEGCDPSTVMFDTTQVTDIAEACTRLGAGQVNYYGLVRMLARDFVRARKGGNDARLNDIGIGILWTALNHPAAGERMRRAVSTALRRDGKAHITWYFGRHGLGLGLAEGFVDMDQLGEHAPKDAVVVYTGRDAIDDERGH